MSTERTTTKRGEAASDSCPPAAFETRDFYLACFLRCASCLLIPRSLVYRIWNRRFGSLNPLVSGTMKIRPLAGSRPRRIGDVCHDSEYDDFADGWADHFAPYFAVSRQAMRIRLEKLGLLLRQSPSQRSLATGT